MDRVRVWIRVRGLRIGLALGLGSGVLLLGLGLGLELGLKSGLGFLNCLPLIGFKSYAYGYAGGVMVMHYIRVDWVQKLRIFGLGLVSRL